MPELDARGHSVPTEDESPSRQGWVLDPLLTVNDPIEVANVTARGQLLAELAALPVPITPSVGAPIYVWRADARTGCQLEATWDGLAWWTVPMVDRLADVTLVPAATWEVPTGTAEYPAPKVRLAGDRVELVEGRLRRTAGQAAIAAGTAVTMTAGVPTAYRPAKDLIIPATAHYGDGTPQLCEIIVRAISGVFDFRPASSAALGPGDAQFVSFPGGASWARV